MCIGCKLIGHGGYPLFELPGLAATYVVGGGFDEPTLTALNPCPQHCQFGIGGDHLVDQLELHMRVSKMAQGCQPAFEDSPRFLKGCARCHTIQQHELSQ
ncbi:MAG: hypothetical protein NT154_09065 [Verrucomicrobia bacterium]|nr:hypothetical protein [Verrucomicrobiota bacterium]